MTSVSEPWEFVHVLPNLVLAESGDDSPGAWPTGISIAPTVFCITRPSDPRVQEIRRSTPAAAQILGYFVDAFGKPYSPAVLIAAKSAPTSVRHSVAAIVAFRNALAIPILLRARAAIASSGGGVETTWSDSFEFHPIRISSRGRAVMWSPALSSGISETAKLRLSHSPYVPLSGRRLWPDHYLLRSLGRAWQRQFNPKQCKSPWNHSLFRSLEVAFRALGVGAKNEGSIHDYGDEIAQWVSALEILAWPANKHANADHVLSLLSGYPLGPSLRVARYSAKVGGRTRRLTALQRACVYLNGARNNFLHGNPVAASQLLTLSRGKRVGLPRLAAIVYRAGLVSYLNQRYPKSIRDVTELRGRADEMFDDHAYEEGLASFFGVDA